MTSYDIGDMFWGKSQSYPWWPCVIMTNSSSEIKRTRKKTGTQFHVQFIGKVYDACWITSNFLIKYDGTEKFESYVEQQLRSSLPPQHKLMFEMKMTGQIQTMWIQACQEAENIYQLSNSERILKLPKLDESYSTIKKPKSKKNVSKQTSKFSETSSLSDNISVETKCLDLEDQNSKDSLLNIEVEEICRKAFLIEEMENRLKNSAEPISPSEIEIMLNEQWNVLDVETKLLYLNGEISNTSKSRVSGRKIKVPSRLRRLNELEDLKKATLKKRLSDSATDKKKSISQDISLVSPVQNTEDSKLSISESSSLQLNSINRETFDSTILQSLEIQNSSMEIFKLIVNKDLPIISEICHQCLQPFKPNEKYKSCQGDCQASYHVMCALNHKLFRVDDNDKCINCVPKDFLCCICKNSKYMKKVSLVKCSKSECSLFFHVTCLKFLNLIDSASDEKDALVCPNHSCLTCSREDIKHPCNSLGPLVACIRCPISYHGDMLCIPAGCRVLSENKIICHRHFETTVPSFSNTLTRCFCCFSENATLRCCRCRGVFHPKCIGLATYADLLKDFVCPTCKLDQPLFHGQVVWVEIDNLWTPAEIVIPTRVSDKSVQYSNKTLVVRTVEHGIYLCVDPCDLVTFVIGESVLTDIMTTNKKVVECAKKMNIVYLNWRKRMKPFSSEKCATLGKNELVKLSTISCSKSNTNCKYEYIRRNIYDEKNIIPSQALTSCSCSSNKELCNGIYCSNYKNKIECHKSNCNNKSCTNRRFTNGFQIKPYVYLNEATNRMCVKVLDNLEKDCLIGELTGHVISADTAYELINESNNFNSTYYIFQLAENLFLNCEKQSNEWRHLNHSCNPNAELVCWNVAGEYRLGISLLKSISNEEVTINFNKSGVIMKYEFICNCGSLNCQKSFGPTSLFANKNNIIVPLCCVNNKKIEESVVSHELIQPKASIIDSISDLSVAQLNFTAKSDQIPLVDDSAIDKVSCHRCGYHGELIVCNKANCNKRYHIQCVEMSSAPKGLWYCPKHFCIECSQAATVFCGNCSTSHCKTHSLFQKRHHCRKFTKAAKITPIIIQNNTSECELITNIPNFVSTNSVSEVESIKEERRVETNKLEEVAVTKENSQIKSEQNNKTNNSRRSDKMPAKSDTLINSNIKIKPDHNIIYTGNIVNPDIIIMKPGQNKIINARKSDRIINANIIIKKPELNRTTSTRKPIQISELNKKDLYSACDLVPILAKNNESEQPVSINPVKINVKRSVDMTKDSPEEIKKPKMHKSSSAEEVMMLPESVEDLSDIRCQVVPLGIEEMENLIISPVILD